MRKQVVGGIEFYGEQHYRPAMMRHWTQQEAEQRFLVTQQHDLIKTQYLHGHGIPQLIIRYDQCKQLPEMVKQFCRKLGLITQSHTEVNTHENI